ncbi:MAG: PA0069 family radical SAM protein [Planctomycetales bacterium]|nr:PA0069 family radical SAM protein [Planctomycetales bacterium]
MENLGIPGPLRGRGAPESPPNRFAEIRYDADPDPQPDPEEPPVAPGTRFFRDTSRSIIATNDSPDVGFDASVNAYRGCETACVYCLAGDTLVLMADGTARPVERVRIGDEIYGTIRRGRLRRYVKTRVLAHWEVLRPAYRVTLEDGTTLIAGGDHRFLTERGWKHVAGERRAHLTVHNKLMGVGRFAAPRARGPEYARGYLSGVIRGDGHLASYHYAREGRSNGDQHQFRLAMADLEALERTARYLVAIGIRTRGFAFQDAAPQRRAIRAIRTHARADVECIRRLIVSPKTPNSEWQEGFLAGIFDAEGSYSQGILRITNTDPSIIQQSLHALSAFQFSHTVETRPGWNKPVHSIRVRGGLREHLRFFHTVAPAICRKMNIEGQAVMSQAKLRVVSVEALPERLPLFDLTTGTGDFVSNGVISHNCYARPTHEYLGLSAGLDFETRILVKEDAPALLRAELSSPRWKPRLLAMSGVTDCYQPAERRLRLTRGCLEVLAEFRNPVAIVTKHRLVTRDADLLADLARDRAASVFLSVTTLDPELVGDLEPRASRPANRLAAIRTLSAAGVPVGVLVAPVIPGLTDHEIPGILAAAAEAGARFAGFVMLRLPYAVSDLFVRWLEVHRPDRKDKVLARIREVRGGRLTDPRFGSRMRGEGVFAEQVRDLFHAACRRAGIEGRAPDLSTAAFRRPAPREGQLALF